MVTAANLARYLRQCHLKDAEPRLAAADSKLWFQALAMLMSQGALFEAAYSARYLQQAFPDSSYIAHSALLLKTLPETVADPRFTSFVDRAEQSVQIVRRSDATAVLLVFCGVNGALGMPLSVAHRWFALLKMHVVYLRDMPGGVFENGLSVLGNNRSSTENALEQIARGLKATEIFCYGNSTGGFGALLYGLELGATAVLALNAFIIAPKRLADRLGERADRVLQRTDLRALYNLRSSRPRVRIVYGAECRDDISSASAMFGCPGITLQPITDSSRHDAHITLMRRGLYGPLLRDALSRTSEPCFPIGSSA